MSLDDGVTSEQVRLLTEVGMVAAGRGFPRQAREIFEGLRILRPERPFPYVGLAVASLNAGDANEAVRILEREGLAACPGDPELRAFLGLALQLAQRRAEGERVLRGVVQEHPDTQAAKLASRLLASG